MSERQVNNGLCSCYDQQPSLHTHTQLGIPCVGFSPINNTPILLHDNDEFINERVYLRGIPIYEDIIAALASLKE